METTSSTSTTRFRFRDRTNLEEITLQDNCNAQGLDQTSSDTFSVSSDYDDDDSELQSMTAKGISHLCSELLELKNESDEDFHKSIYSNYSAFLRVFEDREGLDSELMQLKYQASTQKRLIKDLTERISLKVLSEQAMESMLEENLHSKLSSPSILEAHTEDVSEILDTLLSEHRLDEALSVLEMEARAFQSTYFGEKFSSDELMSYNSAISEKRAMLADQLTLLADNPRVSAPELQKALVGLCKLNDGHLATQLLFNYYHTRIACGTQELQSSKVSLHELYIRELAKFVFSMISQAARSFVALHGEASPFTELIQWATGETESFAACLDKYVRSISEVSDGLSTAVEAVQHAVSYCSLLETQNVVLKSCLMTTIRPSMEQALQIHIDHYKKVIIIFTSNDMWLLGRYLVSGILSNGSLFAIGYQRPEYCLLTNSGRKFVTLFQAIAHDSFPLVALQLEGCILRGLMELFYEYTIMLENALTGGSMQKDGSRTNLAESLVQGVAVIANSSTLVQFFCDIVRSVFGDIYHLKFEIDSYVMFIQDAHVQLRAHFFKQVIQKLLTPDGIQKHVSDSFIGLQKDYDICSLMPSVSYQGFYLQLRGLQKFAEDNYIELGWLKDLLKDLMEALFAWISGRKVIVTVPRDHLTEQQSANLMQVILDIHFLKEIAEHGGYLSDNMKDVTLDIVSHIESALSSAQFTPGRDVNDHKWATDAVIIALQKLEELEEKESVTSEISRDLEEVTNEYESQNSNDLFEDDDDATISSKQSMKSPKDSITRNSNELFEDDDDATVSSKQSMESPKDSITRIASEVFSNAETNISEAEDIELHDIDKNKFRTPKTTLTETYLTLDNVGKAHEMETNSSQDLTNQGMKINEKTIQAQRKLLPQPETFVVQNCHDGDHAEKSVAA